MTFASIISFQNHVLVDERAAGASGRWTEAAFAPEGAMPMRELASRPAQEPGRGHPKAKLPSGYT